MKEGHLLIQCIEWLVRIDGFPIQLMRIRTLEAESPKPPEPSRLHARPLIPPHFAPSPRFDTPPAKLTTNRRQPWSSYNSPPQPRPSYDLDRQWTISATPGFRAPGRGERGQRTARAMSNVTPLRPTRHRNCILFAPSSAGSG